MKLAPAAPTRPAEVGPARDAAIAAFVFAPFALLAGCAPLLGIEDVTEWTGEGGASSLDATAEATLAGRADGSSTAAADAPPEVEVGGVDAGRPSPAVEAGGIADGGGQPAFDEAGDGCATSCNGTCVDLQTDPVNCGACGQPCAGSCIAGRCLVTLATGQTFPGEVAVDAARVYWVNQGSSPGSSTDGAILSVASLGGVPTVLANGQTSPVALAVNSTQVFWITQGLGFPPGPGALLIAPIGGGKPTTLAAQQAGKPSGLVATDTMVYWTNGSLGQVLRMPVGGGSASTVAANQPGPSSIAVDATRVCWANDGGTIVCELLAGGSPTTLASGQLNP